jgi:hypothetical protein
MILGWWAFALVPFIISVVDPEYSLFCHTVLFVVGSRLEGRDFSPEFGIWDTILIWTQNQLCMTAKDLAPILKGTFCDQIYMVAKSPNHNMQFQLPW